MLNQKEQSFFDCLFSTEEPESVEDVTEGMGKQEDKAPEEFVAEAELELYFDDID